MLLPHGLGDWTAGRPAGQGQAMCAVGPRAPVLAAGGDRKSRWDAHARTRTGRLGRFHGSPGDDDRSLIPPLLNKEANKPALFWLLAGSTANSFKAGPAGLIVVLISWRITSLLAVFMANDTQ